ncbi:MAG: hypothetical protein LBT78_11110 [Tannerella sp.]|nr:hypothetical protein [Tannerella sp.]
MPIFHNRVERGNPANPAAPKLWYPVLKSTGLVKEREVARLRKTVISVEQDGYLAPAKSLSCNICYPPSL